MTANLKTESDMHYCLHIIKSPDTYSFCCVSNHYMYYYYYYYYFILPWNCPSLISKLKLYEASHECYPLCLGVQLCIKFAKLPWQ